jgi:fucose 4-O-acetylase-like acetyltransferase
MSAAPATGPVARHKVRIPFWDNARFAVIALVVVGHALLPQIVESDVARTVYLTVYAFHMPAFALISGYFSKASPPGTQRMRKIVSELVVPYLVFQLIWSVIQFFVEGQGGTFNLTLPHWTLWFLLALATFRILLPYLGLLRWPLLWAVLASVFVGYFENVDSTFALSRTIGILPFFIFGWQVKQWHLAERWFALGARAVWIVRAIAIALFAAFATVVAVTLEPMREFGLRDWLLYDDSYRDIGEPTWWAALLRLAFIVIAIVLSAAFFSLVPRRRTWFTVLGAGTMYVYLLHSFVLYPLRQSGFLADHTEPLWVLATIVFAVLLAVVLATPPVRRVFRPLVQPRLNWLFHPVVHRDPEAPAPTSASPPTPPTRPRSRD